MSAAAIPEPDADGSVTIGHIKLTPNHDADRLEAFCLTCGEGVEVGPSFGGIPGATMIKAWLEMSHLHRDDER